MAGAEEHSLGPSPRPQTGGLWRAGCFFAILPGLNSEWLFAKTSASRGFQGPPEGGSHGPPPSLGRWRCPHPRGKGAEPSSPSRALSCLPLTPLPATIPEILTWPLARSLPPFPRLPRPPLPLQDLPCSPAVSVPLCSPPLQAQLTCSSHACAHAHTHRTHSHATTPPPPGHPGCGPVALQEPHQAASFSPDTSHGAVQGRAGLSSPMEPPPPPRGPLSPCDTGSRPVTPAASLAITLPQQRAHSKTLLGPVGTIGLPLPLTEGSSCVWGSHS